MSKKRRQKGGGIPRAPRQPNFSNAQNQEHRPGVPTEAPIPAESIKLAAAMTGEVNEKIHGLMKGLKGLEEFAQDKEGDEDSAAFLAENKEIIEGLLHYDLNATYNQLVQNHATRQGLYKELNERGAITNSELGHLLGVVSTEPFNTFVQSLGTRDPAKTPLQPLTPDDQANLRAAVLANIQVIVTRLQGENKLDQSEADMLVKLGPKTPEQIAEARDQILEKIKRFDISAKTSYSTQYEATITKENKLIDEIDAYTDKYNQITAALVKQIQAMGEKDEREKRQQQRLDALSRQVGMPIKVGAKFGVIDPKKRNSNPNLIYPKDHNLEITNIDFSGEEADPEMLPEFQRKIPTLEPVIEFTVWNDNESVKLKLSASHFRRFAIDNQLGQRFEKIEDLEKELGLSEPIKAGQVLDYMEPKIVGPEEDPEFESRQVTIEKIENDIIYLSNEIILDRPAPGGQLVRNRRTKQLDFGEFARWYRKADVVPDFSDLTKLDAALAIHHQQLVQDKGWPAGHGQPIKCSTFSKPFYLIPAGDPLGPDPFQVTGIDQQGIHIKGEPKPLKPAEFYRRVRDLELTMPTGDQLEQLIEQSLAQKEDGKAEKLANIYDQVVPEDKKSAKMGGPEKTPEMKKIGYWKSLWDNTTFLSLMDMYQVFIKAPVDRLKAWFADRAERRQYRVGKEFYKGFPAFGGLNKLATTFNDQLNGKISKDVSDKVDYYEKNLEPSDTLKELHKVANMKEFNTAKTQLKASMQVCAKKGMLRFEDDDELIAAVNNLNNLNPEGQKGYPAKLHHLLDDPNIPVIVGDPVALSKSGISIFDQYRVIIDNIYGEGTFDGLNSQNDGEYNRQKEDANKNFHRYEFMQGGVGSLLQKWLDDWEQGVEVDSAVFDGLLTKAILDLEISLEQGMLLFISAFSVKNPKGKTLLTFSRLNPYVGTLRDHMMFFFFAVGHDLVDENGNIIEEPDGKGGVKARRGKFSIKNFQKLYREVISKDVEAAKQKGTTGKERFTAGKNTINWIQSECLGANLVRKKIAQKGSAANVDIAHYVGPLMTRESELNRVLRSGIGGGREETPVLFNFYAGYNNQLLLNAQLLNQAKTPAELQAKAKDLADMSYGFLYFNNVLRGRIKSGEGYMHFGAKEYNEKPPADKERTVGRFATESENFLKEFGYEVAKLTGDADFIAQARAMLDPATSTLNEQEEKSFRDNLQVAITGLAKPASEGGKPKELARVAMAASAQMKGMSGAQLTWEERQAMKESSSE